MKADTLSAIGADTTEEAAPLAKQPDAHGRDPDTGRFMAGNPGGGRPKGSRNKFAEDFVAALQMHFRANGAAAIDTVFKEDPSTYLRVCASVMPKEFHVTATPFDGMEADELRRFRLTLSQALERIENGGHAGPLLEALPVDGAAE